MRAERGEAEPSPRPPCCRLSIPPPRPCPNSAVMAMPSSPHRVGKDPGVLAPPVTGSYFTPKCIRLQEKKRGGSRPHKLNLIEIIWVSSPTEDGGATYFSPASPS